jgi:hypothetical protein
MNMITKERRQELAAKIEPLRLQVQAWRQSRPPGQRMPEPLWEAATQLAKEYGVAPVQGILRIDYRGLENRATGASPKASTKTPTAAKATFVELPALVAPRRVEHTIELEDGAGRKLTVKVSGGNLTEVLPLAQAFWRPSL